LKEIPQSGLPHIKIVSSALNKPIDMVNVVGNAIFMYSLSKTYQTVIGSAGNKSSFNFSLAAFPPSGKSLSFG